MSEGAGDAWIVSHLFYKVCRDAPDIRDATARLALALDRADAAPDQVITFSVLGNSADFGVMVLSPDIDRVDCLRHEWETAAAGALAPAGSFVSLTEVSEYAADLPAEQKNHRLHPRLPRRRFLAFYPMSKSRQDGRNWYQLAFDARKALMLGHGRVGRKYAGRINQLITASTGLDDWEWGVTLLSDDIAAIKDIVYEMRFDEVSAVYAEFGPFTVGLVIPATELVPRLGLAGQES